MAPEAAFSVMPAGVAEKQNRDGFFGGARGLQLFIKHDVFSISVYKVTAYAGDMDFSNSSPPWSTLQLQDFDL